MPPAVGATPLDPTFTLSQYELFAATLHIKKVVIIIKLVSKSADAVVTDTAKYDVIHYIYDILKPSVF